MKHRKYRILSILLLACLALQVVGFLGLGGGGAGGVGDLGPAETAAPEEGTDPRSGPRGPHRRPGSDGGTHCPLLRRETEPEATGGAYRGA